jgi:beta-glucosidase/6-phospho-beta-glucosidase/beta-galactosidase
MATKSQASDTVQHFAAFVLRQFEHRVKVFCTDNECTLGKDFKAWIARKALLLNLLPPIP